jgi:hypothetical protein
MNPAIQQRGFNFHQSRAETGKEHLSMWKVYLWAKNRYWSDGAGLKIGG